MKYLCTVLGLMLVAATGVADSSEGNSEAARATLARFNAVPAFIGGRVADAGLEADLEAQCDGMPAPKCLKFMQGNKLRVVEGLPDNPAYWHAFHDFLSAPVLEPNAARFEFNDPQRDMSNLIPALQRWGYLNLASEDLRGGSNQFAAMYRNLRRHYAGATNLLEKMVFAGLVGIAHKHSEALMAALYAQAELEGISTISAELTPFTMEELSLRRVLEGEAQYMQAQIERWGDEVPAGALSRSAEIPPGDMATIKAHFLAKTETQWQKLVPYFGEVSERGWNEYWGQGYADAESALDETDAALIPEHAVFRAYLSSSRSIEVLIYPLLALSDIYLGRATAGIPARQAPAYWTWSWDEVAQRICLQPTHTAPDTGDFSLASGACVSYVPNTAN